MKKVLVFIFILFIGLKGVSQSATPPIIFTDTAQMTVYAGSYFLGMVQNEGFFYRTKTSILVPDNINIFRSVFTGYVWVRQSNVPAGGGGGGGSFAILSTVDSLKLTPSYTNAVILVSQADRGGTFVGRLAMGGFVVDSGVVFQSATPGLVWVRQFTQASELNLKWYGALGIGISGYKQDSVALLNATEYIRRQGFGNLYCPSSDSAYCYAGIGIKSPFNFNIYGDGVNKTKWLYVSINYQPDYLNGTFLFFGTFSTDSAHNMSRTPRYQMYDAPQSQSFIKLRNIGDASAFVIGEVVKPSGWAYNKGHNPLKQGKTIWRKNAYAVVTAISNDTIFLDHPLSMEIIRDNPAYAAWEVANNITAAADTGSAVVFRPNAGVTTNDHLGTDQMGQNITVHDMSFDVSPYDYLNHTFYDTNLVNNPGNVFSLGCGYNVSLYNLQLNAFGNLGGQYLSNFTWHDITVQSARKLFDFGNESNEADVYNIKWQYRNEFKDTLAVAMLYFNNYCHHFSIRNITATGDWNGNNILQISSGVHDAIFQNISMQLPKYNSEGADLVHVVTEDTIRGTYPENVSFSGINIQVADVGRYISYIGEPHVEIKPNGRMSFENSYFSGNVHDGNGKAFFMKFADTVWTFNLQGQHSDSVRTDSTTYLASQYFLQNRDIPLFMWNKTIDTGYYTHTHVISFYPHSLAPAPDSLGLIMWENQQRRLAIKNDSNIVLSIDMDSMNANFNMKIPKAASNSYIPFTVNGSSADVTGNIDLGIMYAQLSGNITTTSAGLSAATGMQLSIPANSTYLYHLEIQLTTSTNNGIKLALDAPSGATISGSAKGNLSDPPSGDALIVPIVVLNTSIGNFTTYTGNGVVSMDFRVTTSSTAGNVTLRWASVSGGDLSTMLAGSWISSTKH